MNKIKISSTAVAVLVMLTIIVAAIAVVNAATEKNKKAPVASGFFEGKSPAQIEATIEKMSGQIMLILADKYGIKKIKGKDVTRKSIENKGVSPYTFADRPMGTDPVRYENEPSIAAKPNSTSILVAASHNQPNAKCVAYRSLDGGATWVKGPELPLRYSTDFCSDPIVRWAPDSSRVYAAYMSIRNNTATADIVVTNSTNNGVTWSTPIVALAGSTATFYDKPWMDVHEAFPGLYTNPKVYVTATGFNSDGSEKIVFTRSLNFGFTFSAPINLATTPVGSPVLIQGSRPKGGKTISSASGDVLACWYNSNTDGSNVGNFSIRCRTSNNYGLSFNPEIQAFNSSNFSKYELPYYLGPSGHFHRAWGSMFPSFTITNDGVAHLVFSALPLPLSQGDPYGEDGDVFYIKATSPSYSQWSAPKRLNDDYSSTAQLYPTITAKLISGGSVLVAAWEDHRASPYYASPPPGIDCGGIGTNCLYDQYYATTGAGGWGSTPNKVLTDVSSVSDYLFIGDYTDSSTNRIAGTTGNAQIVWTDRSDKTSIFDYEDDVYSDQVNVP